MDLETIGQLQAPGYRVAMALTTGGEFDPNLGVGSRFRLVWVQKGSALLRWDDGAVPLVAPALLCLNETPGPRLETSTNFEAQSLWFHPSAVNGAFSFENIRGPFESTAAQDRDWLWPFLQSHSRAPGLLNPGPTAVVKVAHLIDQVRRELSGQPDSYWPCRARSYLLELLIFVDRLFLEAAGAASPHAVLPDPGSKVAAVILYLHSHYADRLSLDQLCREFHTNRTTLSQQFRRGTGSSLTEYLIHLRVRVAASILRDTTLPITEVAERAGFFDVSYFGRAFAKQTGSRPSEYRRMHYREP